ncbi:ubiquinol-cytochrome c reductase iron-sulfur subunit [Algoriphagus sp. AK58]|uniref:QcrA and Rieske domain-containing protein n=1 Tax=Algoriphagus sp. AK58 TaxID=1406877 RepID=UPI00164F1B52|nr:ubiquinol-cytochrome c reductase iron-sulfur subunit [Algoriphagus sp. AK58]MBC6367975.1 Rieske (2Fe-2S) protein [Algoriphagus sp. AK58]
MENIIKSQSGNLTESRRNFLEKAGITAVFGTLGLSFFTSCTSVDDLDPNSPNPPSQNGGITISGNTIRIDLSLQNRLASPGGWLLIENVKTLVANVNGSFVALTSVCTHSGCFDQWAFANNRFICNCHGSIFDPSGRVMQGPATQPLQQYTTTLTGATLTVTR